MNQQTDHDPKLSSFCLALDPLARAESNTASPLQRHTHLKAKLCLRKLFRSVPASHLRRSFPTQFLSNHNTLSSFTAQCGELVSRCPDRNSTRLSVSARVCAALSFLHFSCCTPRRQILPCVRQAEQLSESLSFRMKPVRSQSQLLWLHLAQFFLLKSHSHLAMSGMTRSNAQAERLSPVARLRRP